MKNNNKCLPSAERRLQIRRRFAAAEASGRGGEHQPRACDGQRPDCGAPHHQRHHPVREGGACLRGAGQSGGAEDSAQSQEGLWLGSARPIGSEERQEGWWLDSARPIGGEKRSPPRQKGWWLDSARPIGSEEDTTPRQKGWWLDSIAPGQ